MSQEFIDRIFIEIDNNAIKLEKITKLVYTNNATIEAIKKLIFIIIAFIILSSLGLVYSSSKQIRIKPVVLHSVSDTFICSNFTKEINKWIFHL